MFSCAVKMQKSCHFFCQSELRDQLRKARLDEERASNQLQTSKAKVAKLEVDIAGFRENAMTEFVTSASRAQEDQSVKPIPMSPMPTSMGFPFVAAGSASDVVAKLNAQLIQVSLGCSYGLLVRDLIGNCVCFESPPIRKYLYFPVNLKL